MPGKRAQGELPQGFKLRYTPQGREGVIYGIPCGDGSGGRSLPSASPATGPATPALRHLANGGGLGPFSFQLSATWAGLLPKGPVIARLGEEDRVMCIWQLRDCEVTSVWCRCNELILWRGGSS